MLSEAVFLKENKYSFIRKDSLKDLEKRLEGQMRKALSGFMLNQKEFLRVFVKRVRVAEEKIFGNKLWRYQES